MKSDKPVGVILANLGTPDAPDAPSIRRYLREFLSDPRVVNLPRFVWLPILYSFILPFRPKRLVEKYETIWGEKYGPILELTEALAEKSQQYLHGAAYSADLKVRAAMTYGNPSLKKVIEDLKWEGIEALIVLPLFPQYSAATTAAVFDKLASTFRRSPTLPSLRFISEYHDVSAYIHALTKTIEPHLEKFSEGTRLVFSFHGIPLSQARSGDPYPAQCRRTAELVAHNLAIPEDQWMVTFQSRFGPAPWLQPYTDETMKALPSQGIDKVMVVCPGFAVDCLETLEEIAIQNRDFFLEAGGNEFTYIPALNASDEHAHLISELVSGHLYDSERPL